MERKSCTLKITSQGESGFLFIHKGELYDAQTSHLEGEKAAMEIIGWDAADIEMDTICRRKGKKIPTSLEFLLLETFRLKDEMNADQSPALPEAEVESPIFHGEQMTSEESAPPRVEPKSTEIDQKLLTLLKKTTSIKEFAVFAHSGGLKFHSPEPCSLLNLSPEIFLEPCAALETDEENGPLRFLQLTTAARKSLLIFKKSRHQIIVALNKGTSPAKFMEYFSPSLFE